MSCCTSDICTTRFNSRLRRRSGSVPRVSVSAFSGSSGKLYEGVRVGQLLAVEDVEEDDDDDDDCEFVSEGSMPGGGPAVGRGKGSTQGPVHPGGRTGLGVIPPRIPTSSGRQPSIIAWKSNVQIFEDEQREWSPGGPVTVTPGESLLVGTGTVVE
jgi:hypothetical protein